MNKRICPTPQIVLVMLAVILFEQNTIFAGNKADFCLSDPNQMMVDYFAGMAEPKPFVVLRGRNFAAYQQRLRERILRCAGLWPLPERISLDIHQSEPLNHPWCTITRVGYQLWPGVYVTGLLYMPKDWKERPAPAMLCPHGHWPDDNAYPDVQKRCLVFARNGYVTFSPVQNHHEDPVVGVSHQTLMIWGNMRALDFLQSMPEVDADRIGCCGCSGGGLQTQMLIALDNRVKAATITGLTCDYRRILFPYHSHCHCNHFPGIMQFTDQPQISALGLPAAVQYLTMNDWTKDFESENFPQIHRLYAANGLADRVDCKYWPTEHLYDRPKRERTYWWMEQWLRGVNCPEPAAEPNDIETFPPAKLLNLAVNIPENKGFGQISIFYRQQQGYTPPVISTRRHWQKYRHDMAKALEGLLGLQAELPRGKSKPVRVSVCSTGGVLVERINFPSEGVIQIPAIKLRRKGAVGRLPVVIILDPAGKEELLKESGPGGPSNLAEQGFLVVLPDIRFIGELAKVKLSERNAIVWGRPLPAMACSDIRAVIDGLGPRLPFETRAIKIISRGSGELAAAAIFAAVLDGRISEVDIDFANCCFENRSLPVVPFILQYGDILQWTALLADKKVTVRNIPPQAGEKEWLIEAFEAAGGRKNLNIELPSYVAGSAGN